MFKIKNASREREAQTYMPFLGHVAPGVVLLDDNTLMAVLSFGGVAWETSDAATINANLNHRSAMMMNIARPGLSLATHMVRTLDDGSGYPTAPCHTAFARELDGAYRAKLTNNRLWRNELYMAIMIRPNAGPLNDNFIASMFSMFLANKGGPQERVADPAAIRALDDIVSTISASFARYRPRRLGLRDDGNVQFSEIGEYMRLVLMGDRLKVPLVDGHLGAAIYTDRVIVGRETVEIRHDAGSTYAAMFGLREYPAKTYAGLFDGLLSAPYRCCLTQTFNFLDRVEALARMERKSNQMNTAGDKAASQRDALQAAADRVQGNEIVMGDHHVSLITYASDIVKLRAVAAKAKADLAESGAIIAREDFGLEAAFWAQLPGNGKYRTRPGAISTRNFAGMASLHNYPHGKATGHWGQPLTIFRTSGGTPYSFHFHPPEAQAPDLGNVFVSGPAGSGKTTLILFLLAMAERVGPRGAKRFFFDKDYGGEILVRAAGGEYLALPSGSPTGLAPLKALTTDPADLTFLKGLITGLIGMVLPPEEDRKLTMAIETVMQMPVELRSIGAVRAFLSQSDPIGVGARLEKWCAGGSLGWVLDNVTDEVSVDGMFTGFDMTAILDDAEARGPIMSYLFHRIKAALTGEPVVVAIDEFWKALLDENFRAQINDDLKTMRKKNAILILGTQSPVDAISSDIATAIVQMCPTQILFADHSADEKTYRDGLKLSEAEFYAVRAGLAASGPRRFLVNIVGQEAVACELDLAGMEDLVAVLSGRSKTVNLARRLIDKHGPAPEAWLPLFRNQWRTATAPSGR